VREKIDLPQIQFLVCFFQSQAVGNNFIYTLFGLRETKRKKRGRRESLENILFSTVWFARINGRKESICVGPTKIVIPIN
jgi:hypothetical protein